MFKRVVENKYKIVAGPGAGVSVELKCSLSWEKKNNQIVFEPTKADVIFHSYYDTASSTEYGHDSGLKIEFEPITDKEELEDFEHRMGDSGSKIITEKNKLYDESNLHRTLILSGGWTRHQYKTGDSFGFALCVDPEYHLFLKGTATFLEGGAYAWGDLDNRDTEFEY